MNWRKCITFVILTAGHKEGEKSGSQNQSAGASTSCLTDTTDHQTRHRKTNLLSSQISIKGLSGLDQRQ